MAQSDQALGCRPDTETGPSARLLVVGSDERARRQWLDQLPRTHLQIREATSGAAAFEMLLEEGSELMLVVPPLPDLDAAEFEEMVRAEFPRLQIVGHDTLTLQSFASPELQAVSPIEVVETTDIPLRAQQPAQKAAPPDGRAEVRSWHELVGASEAMRKVYRSAQLVARRSTTVLIQGESGTGKDLLARAIHEASSRSKQSFVVINCAAIPETLLEAELFGYTKGSFTGAAQSRIGRIHAADGGTLFLDEIGDMPLTLQSKLLRFLEQGEVQRIGGTDTLKVDCRVIAATNVDLKGSVTAKQFREDLYYRLAVFPIALPPLRDRMEDLDDLLQHFMTRFCPGYTMSASARRLLFGHHWPGNVRELRNVLERASLFAEERRQIAADDVFF